MPYPATDPHLIRGGIAVDDRGSIGFANDFHFEGVKRFYYITNHRAGQIRAWHAHRQEAKYITVVRGAAIVGAVAIDNWEKPDPGLKPARHVLSAAQPAVLYIPPGFANGFMTLTIDTLLMVFSTFTLEDSLHDDVRFDAQYWNLWEVIAR